MRRAGQLGNGWIDTGSPNLDDIAAQIRIIQQHRKQADRAHLPFEITLVHNGIFNSPEMIERARDIGATRIVVSPPGSPFAPRGIAAEQDYLDFLDGYADAVIDKVKPV